MSKLNKALSIVFAVALMAGCATTETQDTSEIEGAAGMGGVTRDADADAARRDGMGDEAVQLQYVFPFDFDTATLRPEVRSELDKHVLVLRNNSQNVRVEGHADERGTREYNMALAERRANAVANYLIVNGVPRGRIETVSYGEERPAAFGHSDDAWAQNRRVELKIN